MSVSGTNERSRAMNTGSSRYSLVKRMRFTLSFLIILFLISFLLTIFYIMGKERRENVIHESSQILNGLADGISSDIARYKEISRLIMVDEELVEYLRADTGVIDAGLVNITRNSVLEILNVTSMVDSVFVFRNDGQYLATNRGKYMFDHNRMEQEEWEQNIYEKKGGAVISINADNAIFKLNNSPVVTIARIVYDIRTQKKLGIMLMNISNTFLDQKLFNISDKDNLIMGTDGTFLAGNEAIKDIADISRYYDDSLFNGGGSLPVIHDEIVKDRKRYMISACHLPDMPIVIINMSRLDNGLYMYETVYVLLILMAVFLIILFLAGTFINKNVASPIHQLNQAMEKNRMSGKLEKIEGKIPPNEIGVLKDSYNRMVDRVNELFENLIEKEKMIQKTEMRVLQEQIKPHFLYNSLETINFMALDAGATEVHDAVETLGSFYRNFLSKGDREIPLRRELSIIKDYLKLQKLRYGDILDDEYDIADDTLDFMIPKLMLQPIVENSIYHGIRLKGEAGTIKISSRMEGDELHIVVRDTGVGMSDEQIKRILSVNDDGKDRQNSDTESFGLWGTIERVRYYCQTDDVVNIRSEIGEYTEIEFKLRKR